MKLGCSLCADKHVDSNSCFSLSYGKRFRITYLNIEKRITESYRKLSRYGDWLRAGQSGDRIPVGARFSALVQTGPGAHSAYCKMGTASFRGKERPERDAGSSPLLVPWSRKRRAIPLLPLWAVRPVQSLSACTWVNFTTSQEEITPPTLFQTFELMR